MPYSITTRDGITLQNIPDDMPADHPDLKARVATIRGQATRPAATAEAPSSGIMMGLRDPVDAGAQLLRRLVPEGLAKGIDAAGNWLADKGLPVAHSDGVQGVDKIVRDVNTGYEANRKTIQQPDPGFDWARLGGNMLNPANYVGGGSLKGASTIGELIAAGAKAGAVSGAMQPVLDGENFWTDKAKQVGGGAAAGAVMTPVVSKVGESVANGLGKVVDKFSPAGARAVPADHVNVMVNNTFSSQGIAPADISDVLRKSVERQVREAMQAGAKLDPAAMVRKAQFEAVGLTGDAAPTLGQATRDPMQFANEKNLSGVRIKTPQGEGNPLADRFQAQNQRLGNVFDNIGAGGATDRNTAGQTIIDALKAADVPVKQGVDSAYDAARAMTGGRAAELDRGAFSQAANSKLDEGMWGHFVPPEIRSMLNDVTSGKTPFTVETATQMDSILSAAQRRAGEGSPQASAIGVIRKALNDAPMAEAGAPLNNTAADMAGQAARTVDEGVTDVAGRMAQRPALPSGQPALPGPSAAGGAITDLRPIQPPPGAGAVPPINEGMAARQAFAEARAAARSRFSTIEDTPALKAALDGAAPDKFVQQFILNADVRDVKAMKKVLENSPEALQQARAQVAAHLKSAAFGENPSGDKAFLADRYLRTLRAIGPQKLEAFFSPAEIVRLNLAGKVASDINSIPVGAKYGTNTSGTGAAVMNLLSKLSESPLMRKVPGARMISNQIGEIQTERQINNALRPPMEKPAREVSPETMSAIKALFAPGSVAGGVLAGMSVN